MSTSSSVGSTTEEDNLPKIRIYDWHSRTSIFQEQESKLFDPEIEMSLMFNRFMLTYEFSTPTEKYEYIAKHNEQYEHIYNIISTFKLLKKKDGENGPDMLESNVIATLHMEKLHETQLHHATLTILILLNNGRIWSYFDDNYLFAKVFYKKKKQTQPLTTTNSRCLVDCHNILKYVTRYVKYYIIDKIYDPAAGLINTDINLARKCIVRTYSRISAETNEPIYYTKLCFESVANIAMILKTTTYPYIALDLTNAYNNVVFDKAFPILKQYIDTRFQQTNNYYAEGIIRLCYAIKYKDIPLERLMRRNKGIPQGSPISMDLFIIMMDHLIKQVIQELDVGYGL